MPTDDTKKQLAIAERLQLKVLKRFEELLDNGEITSTDMATLCRLLMQNGWNIDPAALPEGIRDKISEDLPAFHDDISPDEVWSEA